VGAAGYAVGKRVEGRQREDEAADVPEEDADVSEEDEGAASGGLTDETMEQLRKLGQLKEEGLLTQEEFDEQKRLLLDTT